MSFINRLVVDSTKSRTDLCSAAASFGTDKSPYSSTHHRHAYTAVYDLLFSSKRWDVLTIGEVGILDNMSMHVWRNYFPQAKLYGFEFFDEKLSTARSHNLPLTQYAKIDVSDKKSLFNAFNDVGEKFDILIDDSTHLFEHQVNFLHAAVDFVKPGGTIIVEDVFRGWDEKFYADALESILPLFSSVTFVETNHDNSKSDGDVVPYFDNDKILVLFRNQTTRSLVKPSLL